MNVEIVGIVEIVEIVRIVEIVGIELNINGNGNDRSCSTFCSTCVYGLAR